MRSDTALDAGIAATVAVDAQRVLEAADGGGTRHDAELARGAARRRECVRVAAVGEALRRLRRRDERAVEEDALLALGRPCCSTTSCSAGADLIGVRSAAAHDGRDGAKRQRTCTTSSRSAAAVSTASGGGIFAIFGTDGGVRSAEAGDAAQRVDRGVVRVVEVEPCACASADGGWLGRPCCAFSEAFRFWLSSAASLL